MYFLDACKNIYGKSPDWLKSPLGWFPLSAILGPDYRRQKQFLVESSSWTAEKLLQYQMNSLFNMAEHAATSTPYYRKLFQDLSLPTRLQSMEQFYRIPPIDKQQVNELGSAIFSDQLPASQKYKVMTGGTSGSPSTFYMSNEAYGREWAFVHDLLKRYGIEPDDRKLSIRGVPLAAGGEHNYTRYNPIYKELQVSPFHITEDIIGRETEKFLAFRPVYIHGYPSALELLAKLALAGGWGYKLKLKGILAISESLYPRQKEIIEKAFECKIISFYGHTERLIFAGNTPCEEGYLLDPRYGFTEIINGELVGTGFINKATPLLRYKTGDIASVLDENRKSSDLFSMMRLEKVEGRWRQEIIIGKSGSKISITALNMHSAIFKNVERFQFYQNRPGKVELRIVPLSTYSEAKDSPAIIKGFKDKVGDELDLAILIVPSIELTGRQKQLFLIQDLDI